MLGCLLLGFGCVGVAFLGFGLVCLFRGLFVICFLGVYCFGCSRIVEVVFLGFDCLLRLGLCLGFSCCVYMFCCFFLLSRCGGVRELSCH